MRPDKLAYEIRLAIEKTRRVGTRYQVVENFCDGIVEIDGPINLTEVAEQLLLRLQIDDLES